MFVTVQVSLLEFLLLEQMVLVLLVLSVPELGELEQ